MRPKPTVAIVNSERNILRSLSFAFEAEGFRVRSYEDTSTALALVDDPADIALLDKTNPPLGGVELFRRLRARRPMPVVFLSAWSEELEAEHKGTALEAEGYLSMPCTPRTVIAYVRKVLSRHPPRPEIVIVSAKLQG